MLSYKASQASSLTVDKIQGCDALLDRSISPRRGGEATVLTAGLSPEGRKHVSEVAQSG